ncbi:hypothetical protein CDAR_528971 [Caerostris darwini]|uniref:BED-type domain-containing protein n=1 Tax=Caerostris darwini TaxID=1538125 RepID=A0AAV4UD73_9ARAC|nr:hypothetical protein CDAR_528971 [Caerostris darwini]
MSRKTSNVWAYFSDSDLNPGRATCNLCLQKIAYKTSISNLKRHIKARHPTIKFRDHRNLLAENDIKKEKDEMEFLNPIQILSVSSQRYSPDNEKESQSTFTEATTPPIISSTAPTNESTTAVLPTILSDIFPTSGSSTIPPQTLSVTSGLSTVPVQMFSTSVSPILSIAPSSQMRPTTGSANKCSGHFENSQDDIPTIAKVWGEKLLVLDREQRLFAEKSINDILFEASLGNLQKHSVKINENP